jgi:hypothetical protein
VPCRAFHDKAQCLVEDDGRCIFMDALDACVEKDKALPCDLFHSRVRSSQSFLGGRWGGRIQSLTLTSSHRSLTPRQSECEEQGHCVFDPSTSECRVARECPLSLSILLSVIAFIQAALHVKLGFSTAPPTICTVFSNLFQWILSLCLATTLLRKRSATP